MSTNLTAMQPGTCWLALMFDFEIRKDCIQSQFHVFLAVSININGLAGAAGLVQSTRFGIEHLKIKEGFIGTAFGNSTSS